MVLSNHLGFTLAYFNNFSTFVLLRPLTFAHNPLGEEYYHCAFINNALVMLLFAPKMLSKDNYLEYSFFSI